MKQADSEGGRDNANPRDLSVQKDLTKPAVKRMILDMMLAPRAYRGYERGLHWLGHNAVAGTLSSSSQLAPCSSLAAHVSRRAASLTPSAYACSMQRQPQKALAPQHKTN